MAHNVSRTEELIGILTDVSHHRFREARSINPESMLYQTTHYAVQEKLLADAFVEDSTNKPVASIDLRNASLTAAGEEFLTAHQSQA
ncbi:hypothetical protein [Loigolactobacillus zhaoyuanensis]|uniref:Uncharacterized protein n=1 Tax=Loigolactobacillus zhaoyuanensis TaxID=2486017 RepID=A0ABW8U9I2_9LACO|nr:hypothetical protein [Loigolactobacillus zhaoyuanensis]